MLTKEDFEKYGFVSQSTNMDGKIAMSANKGDWKKLVCIYYDSDTGLLFIGRSRNIYGRDWIVLAHLKVETADELKWLVERFHVGLIPLKDLL